MSRVLAARFRGAMKARRKEQKLSQAELAKRAGYCMNYIAKVERGTKPNPSVAFIEDVSEVLGVDPLEMMSGTP